LNARATHSFEVVDYDLDATLDCGQAFRWKKAADGWHGVIAGKWVRLQQQGNRIEAQTCQLQKDWKWLADYLQTDTDLAAVLAAFPPDPCLQAAVNAHRGLRLLRQPAWECLAAFIMSSTKQIVQIRQIIELLCDRFGEPVEGPEETGWRGFPSASRLAAASEAELRACKMGFRAKYLCAAAKTVARGELALDQLNYAPPEDVRQRLMRLNGVGEKIADCVRLFAYGHEDAFPIDVWVARALRQHYFRGRNIPLPRLRAFAADRWRGCGGYAQQYLFHYVRNQAGKTPRRMPQPH
jgi:N-glycosylase/DNA lyase